MKKTDYEKVRELAGNIRKENKQILQLTRDLLAELKKLEGSFLDDGIDEVKRYVGSLQKSLMEAEDAFSTISAELEAYALLLELGKGKKSGG